jgi:N-acetylmuramoyl-L-alanine amidase
MAVVSAVAADVPSVLPKIELVYPDSGQRIGAVDSTFIFGSVRGMDESWHFGVLVNGHPAVKHPDGGFLAYVPLTPGLFTMKVEAVCWHEKLDHLLAEKKRIPGRYEDGYLTLIDSIIVEVPEPLTSVPFDSLAIAGEHEPPAGDLILTDGDVLRLAFRGTPGCRAWACINGVIDSLPMVEGKPQPQAYWGEAVFGSNAVPDSLLLKGLYVGSLELTPEMRADSVQVDYMLAPPDPVDLMTRVFTPMITQEEYRLLTMATSRSDEPEAMQTEWSLTVNPPEYPFTVRFTDSVQIVRHGPRKGYLATFQPEGVEALATGAVGDWYRLQLSQNQLGWAYRGSVEPLETGMRPAISHLRSVRADTDSEHIVFRFPLAGKHVFRVQEDARDQLRLRLYGVYSDTDWIRYNDPEELIDRAAWSQPEVGLYEFTIKTAEPIWGYDTYYKGNTLCLQINRPPKDVGSMDGLKIVVDPGHYSDPGAIGPTGLTEAEANLAIALKLAEKLEDAGAIVTMTRTDNRTHVDLYERPAIAKRVDADLFVSVHNNALPDGVNPFANNGTSSFYYHLHSIDLARRVQYRLSDASGLADHGLYYGNLAVIRPTQYPAILVECAFMMIPRQEAALRTEDYQEQLAEGIKQGIEDFLEEFERDIDKRQQSR